MTTNFWPPLIVCGGTDDEGFPFVTVILPTVKSKGEDIHSCPHCGRGDLTDLPAVGRVRAAMNDEVVRVLLVACPDCRQTSYRHQFYAPPAEPDGKPYNVVILDVVNFDRKKGN